MRRPFHLWLGKIDILINNAGYGLGGYIESITIDEAKVSWMYKNSFSVDSVSFILVLSNLTLKLLWCKIMIFLWLIQLHCVQAQFDVNVWGVVRMLQGGKYILIKCVIIMGVCNNLQYWNICIHTIYSLIVAASFKLEEEH